MTLPGTTCGAAFAGEAVPSAMAAARAGAKGVMRIGLRWSEDCTASPTHQSRIGGRSSGLQRDPRRLGRMTTRFFPRDEYFMRLALREAERSVEHDDVPVGCVIAFQGEVIAAAPNERELRGDPTAHCEVLALREAARALGSWRLDGSALYVTLEPCAMCAGAIVLARVPRVVYGAVDPKAGACGSVLDVTGEPRLNHRPEVAGGLLREECAALLTTFFASRR